jgi:hypothetical protein
VHLIPPVRKTLAYHVLLAVAIPRFLEAAAMSVDILLNLFQPEAYYRSAASGNKGPRKYG